MPWYRPLSTISIQDLPEVGGKAARLGEALRLGAPVLPGVTLSTELYRRFMRQGGLQGEIASILATMQPRTITHFQATEWAIRSAFQVRRTPDEVSRAIREAWHALGDVPVAVRSSATNEDSPQQSFVGQHATFLEVSSEEQALEAVLGCWMSLYSAKALAYARCFGVDLLSSSMAVIMQPMIQPVVRGALFTADPITGDPDHLVLEIDRDGQISDHYLDPYERQPGEQPTWSQLRHLGLLLDEHHVEYQAIEWALTRDSQLYVMRVRPLTQVPLYLPPPTTQIVGGQSDWERIARPDKAPRAMQPFSWYHRSRDPAMNAAYYRAATRLLAPHMSREDVYSYGYLYVRWHSFAVGPPERPGVLRHILLSMRRLYAARALDREQRALWQEERPTLDALHKVDLSALSNRQVANHLRHIIEAGDAFWEQCGRLARAPEVLSEIFCRLHETWLGGPPDCDIVLWAPRDPRARWQDALYELATTSFETPEAEDKALAAFQVEYGHFFLGQDPLASWRDLCTLEVDANAIRGRLEQMRQQASAGQLVPPAEERQRRQQAQVAAERQALARLHRWQQTLYHRVLHLTRRYAPLGVQLEEPVLLARSLERALVMEVGRRLQVEGLAREARDACCLGFQELLDWLDELLPRDELVRLLMERKELCRRWWRYSPPSHLRATVSTVATEATQQEVPANYVLQGVAVSPGTASGPARVVNTLGETTAILPGEILVCREPLFELSPLFSIVAAVVAEQGGLLDHAGVLAREYSVPAIFGVEGATKEIKPGERLLVDANHGLVVRQIHEPEWESL